MSFNLVVEGIVVLTVLSWFTLAVIMGFSLRRHRSVWTVLVAGLGLILTAASIDFLGDLVGKRGILFGFKNACYALGGILVSTGMAAWSRLTISTVKALERLACTDELTGVLNRRGLMNRIEEELKRAQRSEDHLIVLMVDIDDLKVINDRFGHLAGDRVLFTVSETLRHEFRRRDDVVGRFGGDEFVVMFRGGDAELAADQGARVKAEFLRRASELGIPAGISVGVSCYPEDALTALGLIDAADKNMYRDKDRGKPTP